MKASRLTEIRALAEKHNNGRSKCVEMLLECLDEIQRLQRRREASRGPSLDDVMTYAAEIGLNSGEPEKFFDHHQARGWMMGPRGTVPMRDFKAALRTWKRYETARSEPKKGGFGVG